MTPIYRLLADNKEITQTLSKHLIRIHHHDQRGYESDTLEIVYADDHSMALPRKGVTVTLELGFKDHKGQFLVDRGQFVFDEPHHDNDGSGDQITIACKAADMRGSLKSQKTRSFDETTVGQVVSDIAKAHSLTPRISEKLAAIKIPHLDQTGESDINLVTRLAQVHNAQAKIANGYLAFVGKNEGKTASGKVLKETIISRNDGDTHHYESADREQVGTVVTLWKDTKTGLQHKTTAGSGEPIKQFKNKVYGTTEDAQEAANGELKKLEGAVEKLTVNKAIADPYLFAEMPINAQGYRQEIDGTGWFIDSIDTTLETGEDGGMWQDISMDRGKKVEESER